MSVVESFRFSCPNCRCFVTASRAQAGQEVSCKTCLGKVVVPGDSPPAAAATAPAAAAPTPGSAALPPREDAPPPLKSERRRQHHAAHAPQQAPARGGFWNILWWAGLVAFVLGALICFCGITMGDEAFDWIGPGIWIFTGGAIAARVAKVMRRL